MQLKSKTVLISLGVLAIVSTTIYLSNNPTLKVSRGDSREIISVSDNQHPNTPPRSREEKPGTAPLSVLNRQEFSSTAPQTEPSLGAPKDLSASSDSTTVAKHFLETQEYSEMTPSEVKNLLQKMTLGEGVEFQQSRTNHLSTLAEQGSENPEAVKFLQSLEGVFHSEFVDNLPIANEETYSIDLNLSRHKVQVAFVLGGRTYYKHVFTDLNNELKTAKSTAVPANLFLELPAKAQDGYLHPMYLEILIGSDHRTLLGVLYNTNQTVTSAANYLHAENLIFKKVE